MYLADRYCYPVTLGAAFLLLVSLAACGSEEAGREKVARPSHLAGRAAPALTVGAERGPCAPDGSCDLGLVCNGGHCADESQVCTVLHGQGTRTWEAATRAFGPCTSLTCDVNYHLEGDACVSVARSCTPLPPHATAATQRWTGGAYGPCTASACAKSYVVSAGACRADNLGAACTDDDACASGRCSTETGGAGKGRCAPAGMVLIPAGTFRMGSPTGTVGDSKEERQHRVTLRRAFYLGRTEVTQGAWKAISGGINPSCFQSPTGAGCTASNANDTGPVEKLDWYSAVGFANAMSAAEGLPLCYALSGCTDPSDGWRDGIHSGCDGAVFEGLTCTGYRLPTESEWEHAARAGTTTATYAGDIVDSTCPSVLTGAGGFPAGTTLEALAWYSCNTGSADGPPRVAPGGDKAGAQGKPGRAQEVLKERTQPVGRKAANQWGLLDMLGNVEEWTADWHGPYPGTVTDPTGAKTGSDRVFRGGSWVNDARKVRAASRRAYTAGLRNNYLGFRLARTAP